MAIRLPAEHQDDVQLPWARFPFTATTQLAQPSSLPPAPAAASASPHASGGAPALPDRGVGSSQPAQHAEHAAARPAAGAGTADPGVEQEDEDDEEEEDEEAWRLEQRRHPIFVLPPYVLQQQQVPPAQPAAAGRGQVGARCLPTGLSRTAVAHQQLLPGRALFAYQSDAVLGRSTSVAPRRLALMPRRACRRRPPTSSKAASRRGHNRALPRRRRCKRQCGP